MTDFHKAIEDYIRQQAHPVEKFGHQARLYALTRQVGEGVTYDDDVVFGAAWLHDLGVFTGHRPEDPSALAAWDHVAYATRKAPQILSQAGFPHSKIAAVIDAIRAHLPSATPNSIEGEILRDADILEQLGAVGVLRTVCKVGRDTRFPDFTSAVGALRRALANLPQQLRLEPARRLAQPRINTLEAFLAQVDAEAGLYLY